MLRATEYNVRQIDRDDYCIVIVIAVEITVPDNVQPSAAMHVFVYDSFILRLSRMAMQNELDGLVNDYRL